MNLTRTRVARILIVGATLGMTIGLASSGLTAAAAEPPTAPAPPATEPVAETTPPSQRRSGRTCDDHRACNAIVAGVHRLQIQ